MNDYDKPIYVMQVFEKIDELKNSKTGEGLGWPDTGCVDTVGFHYNIEDAINAMHENACDIQETCYYFGFVYTKWPGVYGRGGTPNDRIFFAWDEEKKGFYESEEPEIFKHIAL